MNTSQMIALGLIGQKNVPINIDFTTLPDGALPAALTGATWAIAGGRAVNNPTLGAELLTDPGLEASYTAGRCTTLTASGSPAVAQSADVHGGTKAQQFAATAVNNSLSWAAYTPVAGNWHQFSVWGKRTVGTAGNEQTGLSATNSLPAGQQLIFINSAAYQKYSVDLISTDTNTVNRRAVRTSASSNWDTVIVDDGSHKLITFSTLYALLQPSSANAIVKVQPDALIDGDGTHMGILLRSNADASNCVFVMFAARPGSATLANVNVIKKIGTAYSSVLAETSVTIAADAWLEVVANGASIQVFYNGIQVGLDLSISDAEIINNKQHGMFSAGGNKLKAFMSQAI